MHSAALDCGAERRFPAAETPVLYRPEPTRGDAAPERTPIPDLHHSSAHLCRPLAFMVLLPHKAPDGTPCRPLSAFTAPTAPPMPARGNAMGPPTTNQPRRNAPSSRIPNPGSHPRPSASQPPLPKPSRPLRPSVHPPLSFSASLLPHRFRRPHLVHIRHPSILRHAGNNLRGCRISWHHIRESSRVS